MNFKQLLAIVFLINSSYAALAQKAPVADSITLAVNPNFEKAGTIKRLLLGTNYRKVWAQPIKIPVFHLNTEKGGLKITGTGGGNQTTSLQLEDSAGHEWVLRSVNKSISRDQPKIYKHTLVENLMVDAGSIGHPYSALVVPPMADALGLPHTNPKVVYLGDDPELGKYREEFANKPYLFEERNSMGGSKDIKTEKLQEKLQEDNDKKVDQKMILRARLFDMVVGDWDRHGGQWKWIKGTDSTKGDYVAFPHDRDKVFYTTGGAAFYVMSFIKPNLQAYSDHIRRVDLWNYNTVTFDLYFLNQLDEKDWEEQIAFVQNALTDDLIRRSLKLMPANVYAVSAPQIIKTFIKRRNNMRQYALSYYHFLAQKVYVNASDKSEKFTVKMLDGNHVQVTINKIKKSGDEGKVLYQRTFDAKHTHSLHLYGLEGKNVFNVTGNSPSPIKIRMIGGNDTDTYHIDSTLNDRKHLYIYDRKDLPNNLPPSSAAHLIVKTDTSVNRFVPGQNKYNTITPLLGIGYSTEDGLQLVGGINYITYGFHKQPFSTQQQFKVNYTLARESFIFNYTGQFKNVVNHNDLLVNVLVRGPRNTNNFFGLGNEGEFINSGDKKFYYYRNRYDYSTVDIRLAHQYGNWQVSGGALTEYFIASPKNNQDHFFSEYNQLHPELRLFDNKLYAGLVAGALLDTRNNKQFASKGVTWRTTVTGLTGVTGADHTNASILSTFSFFVPLKDSTIVIADRVGAGHFFGTGEFFQMMNLGGLSLQGFHTSRFIGNTMLYNNLELRAKLFDFNAYVFPSAFGVVGFNDTGRVWLKGEASTTVHDTYGGGIYLTPYNAFLLQAVVGKSPEGVLTYLSLGFRF